MHMDFADKDPNIFLYITAIICSKEIRIRGLYLYINEKQIPSHKLIVLFFKFEENGHYHDKGNSVKLSGEK